MPLTIAAASACRQPLKALLEDTSQAVAAGLNGKSPHVAFAFFTNHFEDEGMVISKELRRTLGVEALIGCTAEGVIGPQHEHENEPALAVWAAALPEGTQVRPFHFSQAELEATQSEEEWQSLLGQLPVAASPTFLAMADPFSIDIAKVMGGLGEQYPGRPLFGGVASGSEAPAQAALLCGDEVRRDGLVGVALAGPIQVDSLVSQGCRPVGRPLVVTKAERHVIYSMGGRKPLELLVEIFQEATPAEQRLMQRGIFLGRAVKEEKETFGPGDFLIRNLMDKDDRTGAIAINDFVRPGVTVQFHVRDAATADEDLKTLAARQPPPAGALLFSCNGRGTNLFATKDHDITALRNAWGEVPTIGFFAAGELGPVGGRNFIHGFTASAALFR